MVYNENRDYPRLQTFNKKGKAVYKKHPLFKTRTGFLSFRFKDRRSDLEKYGPGVVIFF